VDAVDESYGDFKRGFERDWASIPERRMQATVIVEPEIVGDAGVGLAQRRPASRRHELGFEAS
jgi:hypothetical protein